MIKIDLLKNNPEAILALANSFAGYSYNKSIGMCLLHR